MQWLTSEAGGDDRRKSFGEKEMDRAGTEIQKWAKALRLNSTRALFVHCSVEPHGPLPITRYIGGDLN